MPLLDIRIAHVGKKYDKEIVNMQAKSSKNLVKTIL